jgi:hypothetical protein
MKDGTVREFKHEGRAGGSFSKSVKFEGGFAIVTDEWYKKTAFPAQDIATVEDTPDRY